MKSLSAASFLHVTLVGSTASGLISFALIDASFKSSALLLLAAIACIALVRASAATRHLVWAAALLGLLLMPACALLLPDWQILPTWLCLENRVEKNAPFTRQLSLGSSLVLDNSEMAEGREPVYRSQTVATLSHAYPPVASMQNKLEFSQSSPEYAAATHSLYTPMQIRLPASIVIIVWAAGCLVCLLPVIVSFFRLRSMERKYQSNRPLSQKSIRHLTKIASDLGVAVPHVIVAPAGTMPMVWSFGRTRLMLPSDMNHWSASKTKAVLLHELIHLRRHDPLVCSLGLIGRALNWFNPVSWYAVHRLRMECERACDDEVLQQGIEASDYAGHLLELSTFVRFESRGLELAMAMATRPGIESRIASILDETQNRHGVTTASVFAMFAAVSIGTAVLASTATKTTSKELTHDDQEFVAANEAAVENEGDDVVDNLSEPRLDSEPLANTADAARSIVNEDPEKFLSVSLSLEECIAHALVKSQVVHVPSDHVERALKDLDDRKDALSWKSKASTTPRAPTVRSHLVNRNPVVLERINEDISIGQYEERIRNLVRDVEFAYWDLFAEYFKVESARTALDSAALAHKIVHAKLQEGASANAEAQARAAYHQFKAQLDAAIAGGGNGNEPGLFACEQNLRLLIGWASDDCRLIRPTDNPAVGFVEFNWDAARRETLCRNIDLRQQKWAIKQRELELVSAKNQSMPDVNRQVNYRWLGVGSSLLYNQGGNQPFPVGRPSAFEELFGGNYQKGGILAEFNPDAFGSRRQLNDVRNKQLALARESRVLEAKEIAAVSILTRLLRQVDSQHKQLTGFSTVFTAAEMLVEVSQERFNADGDNSDSVVDNLLRAQQTRASASQNFIRSLAEYNKSLVEIHALKGSLLEYNNLVLRDALPLCP